MAEVKIDISADTQGAVSGINRVSQSLQKLPNPTNQATHALTNLSRVAQDAPYGFIGIANNINPLLESFQRLKQTTGTTGSAFKELGKSLIGPAGIGLAVGVVSSLLVVFSDKLFGSGKAAKEAKDANDKLAESLSKDIVSLTALVGVIQNANTSQQDRVKALQAINQQYGEYLPNLSKEGITVENLAASYDKIVKSLLRQAVVKGLMEEIEKEVKSTASAIIALQKAEEQKRIAQDKSNKTTDVQSSAIEDANKEQQRYNQTIRDGNLAFQKSVQVQNAQIGAVNNYETALARLEKQLMDKIAPALNIANSFGDLDIELNKVKVTKIKEPLDLSNLYPIKVKESEVEFPLNFKYPSATFVQMFGKDMQKAFEKFDPGIIKAMQDWAEDQKAKEAATKLAEGLADSIKSGVSDSLANIGDAIGEALIGGDVGSALKGFVTSIGTALQAIGKQLIAIGVAALLAKEALKKLFSNPAVAIAAGVALVAAGGAMKNVLSGGLPRRAAGGPVHGATVVGERGPEIFFPSTSGRIVANNQLGGLAGAGVPVVNMYGRFGISGDQLKVFFSRTEKRQNRYR